MTVFAAVLTAVAVDLWRPTAHRLVVVRLGPAPRAWRLPRPRPVMLAVPIAAVALLLGRGPLVLVGLALAGAVWAAAGVVGAARRRSRAAGRRRAMVETLSFLVSELRAGAVPELALASVAAESSDLAAAARAAARGADLVPVLIESAATPGLEALRSVAAAWQVADRSGAPVADVLARVVDRVRDDLDLDLRSRLSWRRPGRRPASWRCSPWRGWPSVRGPAEIRSASSPRRGWVARASP